ncbi:MAG: hypothetical protein ACNA8W_03445 [Bradymonadaceae bacterium]
MNLRAKEIANLLLRCGSLRADDPDHQQVRAELLGDADLFDDVEERLSGVGYQLVERLGHIGVRICADTVDAAELRNQMGLHAGHIRVLVYLWVHLVYREWTNLRREQESAPPGAAQEDMFGDGDNEPMAISLGHVQNDFSETMSQAYFKRLMTGLQRRRFISVDQKRDRIWAGAALYTLIDMHRMEDFVTEIARRMGADDPIDAVTAVAAGGEQMSLAKADEEEIP